MRLVVFGVCLVALLLTCSSVRADLIFSENIGTGSGTTLIGSYAGWQNNGVLTFSGTGDVRNTSVSNGYTDASGNGNVFLTSNNSSSFQIAAINTSSYLPSSFDLSFGAFKSTIASDMSDLVLSYSTDGLTYTPVSIPAQATGSGTAIWRQISLNNISLPTVNNLRLRWVNSSTVTQFRLDDISLTADISAVPEPSSLAVGGLVAMGAAWFRRRR